MNGVDGKIPRPILHQVRTLRENKNRVLLRFQMETFYSQKSHLVWRMETWSAIAQNQKNGLGNLAMFQLSFTLMKPGETVF